MSKGFSFSDIMQQAQKIGEQLAKVQEENAAKTVEATAGGGMVRVKMNGRMELMAIEIDPQVLQSGDTEMLQDLIIAAVNQGIRAAQQLVAGEMSKLTGGLKIPGLS